MNTNKKMGLLNQALKGAEDFFSKENEDKDLETMGDEVTKEKLGTTSLKLPVQGDITEQIREIVEANIKPLRGLLLSMHSTLEDIQSEKFTNIKDLEKHLDRIKYEADNLDIAALRTIKELPHDAREKIKEYHMELIAKYEAFVVVLRDHKTSTDTLAQMTDEYENSKEGRINETDVEKAAGALIVKYAEFRKGDILRMEDTIKTSLILLGECCGYLQGLLLKVKTTDMQYVRDLESTSNEAFMGELQNL